MEKLHCCCLQVILRVVRLSFFPLVLFCLSGQALFARMHKKPLAPREVSDAVDVGEKQSKMASSPRFW
jgi:hypothetical protein